jgi:hypothetical protein
MYNHIIINTITHRLVDLLTDKKGLSDCHDNDVIDPISH